MKHNLLMFFAMMVALLVGMTSCRCINEAPCEVQPLVGKAHDYGDQGNWMIFTAEEDAVQPVDLFYLYPTCVSRQCKNEVGELEDIVKHNARLSYLRGAECMAGYTNVYAPFYRQLSSVAIMKSIGNNALFETKARESAVRTDVYAALDYFFENVNNGRPFILAGHSQGSCLLKCVLSEYMRVHPEYLERMVACYAIGYHFPESWFAANPHIKKAQGERDTGVLISWNTEAPGATQPNFCIGGDEGSFAINPLNWKTDETPADVSQNLGSITVTSDTLEKSVGPGKVGARIDLKRGALLCEGSTDYLPANPLFGDKSFHLDDWDFYYCNIQENAKKRIQAYFGK